MVRSVRSNGAVDVRRCNNCLAVQVTFDNDDGKTITKTVSPD